MSLYFYAFWYSLKQQNDEEISTLLQRLKDALSEKCVLLLLSILDITFILLFSDTRCPENAEKCKRLRSDWSKLQATLNRFYQELLSI